MGVFELFEKYISQAENNNCKNCNHMDIGPGHFDYPHQDGHVDED